MRQPKTLYAIGPEGHVGYQVIGDGELDIVFVPDWCTNLEIMWEEPSQARFLDRLSSIGRLICFDKRGTGVSDPIPLGAIPTIEQWMDDITTVMADIDSERAAVIGHGDGAPLACLFAATYPDRTSALVLSDTYARRLRRLNYSCGMPKQVARYVQQRAIQEWGTGEATKAAAPSLYNAAFVKWRGRYERLSMSPGEFEALYPMTYKTDVRPLLKTIRVPTLVTHRKDNIYVISKNGEYLAKHIKDARYVEIPGSDHFFHAGNTKMFFSAVQEFLTGAKEVEDDDRVLATVLFTDIVDATEHAARLGDSKWHDLISRHHEVVRQQLEHFRGKEIDTAGDGFFATFDGPARAVRCALTIRDELRVLGIEIRAGLHTGECEIIGRKVGGIAVHIGARVMGLANPGEVLISRTIRDLVAGSGLKFTDAGTHELKGIEGDWILFSAD